jgi:hypothetical protein
LTNPRFNEYKKFNLFLLFFFNISFLYSQNDLTKKKENDTTYSKKIFQLEEIKIEKKDFNSKYFTSLGLKTPKKYTIAERRYFEASSGINGFINLINGNLKMLKKCIEVEKKEMYLNKLKLLLQNELKDIPLNFTENEIEGFKYYIIEDPDFIKILNSKNVPLIKFKILDLSIKYKER